MPKKVFDQKFECFQANKNKTGSNVTLANNIQTTEKGPVSRSAVSIVVPDNKAAGFFEPGKSYQVTITEL